MEKIFKLRSYVVRDYRHGKWIDRVRHWNYGFVFLVDFKNKEICIWPNNGFKFWLNIGKYQYKFGFEFASYKFRESDDDDDDWED